MATYSAAYSWVSAEDCKSMYKVCLHESQFYQFVPEKEFDWVEVVAGYIALGVRSSLGWPDKHMQIVAWYGISHFLDSNTKTAV